MSDVGDQFDTTLGNIGCELAMSPADMAKYRITMLIYSTPSGKVMVVNDNMILKLHPIRVDMTVIAHNMMLAATVVNVPKVYDFGISGNCGYILMEYVNSGVSLQTMLQRRRGYWHWILSKVSIEIKMIVRALASVGLSHNDLYPRNILVGLQWEVVSVLDWDESGPLQSSYEYARHARLSSGDPTNHLWDYIFLDSSLYPPTRPENLLNTKKFAKAPLIRSPPGRTIGPLLEVIDVKKYFAAENQEGSTHRDVEACSQREVAHPVRNRKRARIGGTGSGERTRVRRCKRQVQEDTVTV